MPIRLEIFVMVFLTILLAAYFFVPERLGLQFSMVTFVAFLVVYAFALLCAVAVSYSHKKDPSSDDKHD